MKLSLPILGKSNNNQNAGFVVVDLTKTSCKVIHLIKEDHKLLAKGVAMSIVDHNDSIDSKVLRTTLDDCFSQSGYKTNEAILGLSGPDTFGFILIARQVREKKELKITNEEFNDIYEKIKNAAYLKAKKRWANFYANTTEFEALDMVITSVKVDDLEVNNAVGMMGSEILITAFCSYANVELYDFATALLSKNKMTMLAATTNLYATSKLLSEKESNFIVIDIGRSYTDVGIVFGKSLINTKSFDMGGEFFSEYLANKTNTSIEAANGKKESYSDESLNEEEADKIGDILFEAGKYWVHALTTILSSFNDVKSFPSKIYVCGGGAILPVVMELLYDKELLKNIPISGSVDVKLTDSSMWVQYVRDELNLLSGSQMFVPTSLSVIYLELK